MKDLVRTYNLKYPLETPSKWFVGVDIIQTVTLRRPKTRDYFGLQLKKEGSDPLHLAKLISRISNLTEKQVGELDLEDMNGLSTLFTEMLGLKEEVDDSDE